MFLESYSVPEQLIQESQSNSGPLQVIYSNPLLKAWTLHQSLARQLKLELLLQQFSLLSLFSIYETLTLPFAHLREINF